MAHVTISEDSLRQMLRQAVADALDDRRDLLRDVMAEVLEDVALAEAIRSGLETDRVERDDVFAALDGAS
ncbi:hypothetical protein [Rubrivirga litoralis]|uniref:Uncharacterized protein n=2 Tax=Rubrivirga TaxID=1434037 RepID=A0ABU3BRV0_9BACT|nr:hypothetical protein [Rubrivirga sp. F394]MDT0632014.1 hypothetical protein [Rubrivirga sp. F394]